jgi:hypothetical protein
MNVSSPDINVDYSSLRFCVLRMFDTRVKEHLIIIIIIIIAIIVIRRVLSKP